MKQYDLFFHGYTWDEYFHVISNKSGILIAYIGRIDSEGFIKMDKILSADEADEIGNIYKSKYLNDIRNRLVGSSMLFFSYAEIKKDDRLKVTQVLKRLLMPNVSYERGPSDIKVCCKGACALFPKDLL